MQTHTLRLTMAQALVRYLAAQRIELEGREVPLIGGVFAIFGHGNVAGLGEALAEQREALPTFRGHNEQAMGHAAIGFAKAYARRRFMACTTSIGPGATNLVTAAATAHVNRLPLLLLPGDVFASRVPDPVLQQLESFQDPNLTVNDCLRPVSRYFDRIMRPEQILSSLPQALRVLLDPAECGPVTLALPQDVQTESFECPRAWLEPRLHRIRRVVPEPESLREVVEIVRGARRPLIVAGGGVIYSGAADALAAFAARHGVPVAETQAGKGSLPASHPRLLGGLGVTGTAAANALAREADLVLAVGSRLGDFTTASRTLFAGPGVRLVAINVQGFDATKHDSIPLVADAREGLAALSSLLGAYAADPTWTARAAELRDAWCAVVERVTRAEGDGLPTDAQVLGAVNRAAEARSVVVAAAGGLPGELHKLWHTSGPGSYHVEYGYSCMGYEIAGALGVKLADPERQVLVLVGDGSYLMMNSELATSVSLGLPLVVVVLDNHGFGCIHRLQRATGGAPFNNLLAVPDAEDARIDLARHASSLGAHAERVATIAELESALARAGGRARTTVLVIETDPEISTVEGGAWWDVAVPEVSERSEVKIARQRYLEAGGVRAGAR